MKRDEIKSLFSDVFEKDPNNSFAISCKEFYCKKGYLTSKQIKSLNLIKYKKRRIIKNTKSYDADVHDYDDMWYYQ